MKKGFDTESIILYSLNKDNFRHYLPDSIRYKISLQSNRGYWPVLHDKLIFYRYIKNLLPTPELIATVFDGNVTYLNTGYGDTNFLDVIINAGGVVLKHLQGAKGKGIFFLLYCNDHFILQGKPIKKSDVKLILKELDCYGIFQYQQQHEFFSKIFSGVANTIRLVTFYDNEENESFIFAAVLRMGNSSSDSIVDNFSQGGLISMIDLSTGELSGWKRKGENGKVLEGTAHPDTGTIIQGKRVPHWSMIKEEFLNMLSKEPIFDYVGWDVMVTAEGFTVIEGNHNPDLNLIQLFQPYLQDRRTMNYFSRLGIFKAF
ncbi:sugar-transfer associated ATP-grasp domain-containing protein [Autumnicola psychrophila]|uniref:Sugar-transfer associated ATP-grasp domain-containing protein n=1 Tax=Autumnicola psychrophila TaxID=3075592 RepID=A0ABU3DS83_9FLAO|nr:sugar-transfer associated ATP-grasp domain-containing protein [Zunongwangia sp. F225]MDT0686569.1 sugar-transfer associated ATP-grasp domain-containing protein [Zunongwangia sp. F225]